MNDNWRLCVPFLASVQYLTEPEKEALGWIYSLLGKIGERPQNIGGSSPTTKAIQ